MPNRRRRRTRKTLSVDQHIAFNRSATKEHECQVCEVICNSANQLESHFQGKRHRLGLLATRLKTRRSELTQNKGSVEISANCGIANDAYCVDVQENIAREITFILKNTGRENVRLAHCDFLKRMRVFSINVEREVVNIGPGKTREITVTAKCKCVGNYHAPIGFQFSGNIQDFQIVKMLRVHCRNNVTDAVKPTAPFKRPTRVAKQREASRIITGYPLPKWTGDELEKTLPLELYHIPSTLRSLLNRGLSDMKGLTDTEKMELQTISKMIKDPLQFQTYTKRFQTLLFFEEMQMEVDIRKYNLENVAMTTSKNNRRLIALEVPGLAENRPSVVKGDWLYVRVNSDKNQGDEHTEYQGFVHEVRQNEVALGFSDQLMGRFVNNMKFDVRFVFNRLPLRLQHRGCELAETKRLEEVLFPREDTLCTERQRKCQTLRFYNKMLEKNEQQRTAIENIVMGVSRPAPYIVFGPPGTGKTVTIVEAMMQILKITTNAKILVCAPSNSASDLIAQRLLKFGLQKSSILRLNASSRAWDSVPDDIKDVCNYEKGSGHFYFPTKENIKKFKVLICTLVTSGRLVSADVEVGHFTHIFVDESGHAMEPECLIPLTGLLCIDKRVPDRTSQLVLAGDPKQLGPVLRSPFAMQYGLDVSFLERLMNNADIYSQKDQNNEPVYDKRVITKLLQNYRSHPSILHLPNQMFYENELMCSAEKILRERFCEWDELPKRNFPVIFHGVAGKDEREERSPSFFNAAEVSVVVDYVEKVLNKKGGFKVEQKDIGIISPYRKQVQKIQQILKQKRWKDIFVGSVEQFQGQERLVIIVSTVRSNPDYLCLDVKFKLGFLKNPKRFNVTLTRAKALLVVVGDPFILSEDEYWGSFIAYCQKQGGYHGVEFDGDCESLTKDAIQRLENIIHPSEKDTSGMNDLLEENENQEEVEWIANI